MPFIDEQSLNEMKAKVWEEGFNAGRLGEYTKVCDYYKNPYVDLVKTLPKLSSLPKMPYTRESYCPEGGCNED